MGQLGTGGVFAVVLVAYVLGSGIAWWMIRASDLGAVLFPPAGLTLVAFLSVPRRRWPAVIAAIVAGEYLATAAFGTNDDQVSVAGYAAANTLEPIVATLVIVSLLRRLHGAPRIPDLADLRQLGVVGLGAVCLGPAVGATIGTATSLWRFDVDAAELFPQWWLGDALGVVLVAPLFLVWSATPGIRDWRSPWATTTSVAIALAAAAVLTVADLPLLFLVLIALVVLGAMFDVRTVAIAGVAVAVVSGVSLALDPDGLIGGLEPTTALWVTKVELLFFLLVAYAVAAEVNARHLAAVNALHQSATVAELQRLLLPPPSLTGPGFRVEGVYEAAVRDMGVGGDWYLVRRLQDGRIIIGVGDIVGHDLDAARTMAAVRSGLLLEAALDPTPHRLLDRLDRFAAVEPSIRYGTAWLAWFDPVERTLEYACAGHPPPLLVEDGVTRRLDGSNSALIGMPQGERTSSCVRVRPGACLALYTDGLVERRTAPLDAGIERLVRTLADHHLDPRAVVDEMLADSPRDDDTILVMIELGNAESPPTAGDAESAGATDQSPADTAGDDAPLGVR